MLGNMSKKKNIPVYRELCVALFHNENRIHSDKVGHRLALPGSYFQKIFFQKRSCTPLILFYMEPKSKLH